jgi:hypothetical protein
MRKQTKSTCFAKNIYFLEFIHCYAALFPIWLFPAHKWLFCTRIYLVTLWLSAAPRRAAK